MHPNRPHRAPTKFKKVNTSVLCLIAALYCSSKGTFALVAQKFCMYRAAANNETARNAGQIQRQEATNISLRPEMKNK